MSLILPDWRTRLLTRTSTRRLFLLPLLLTLGFTVNADVIDPFTAAQGPFTVGPGEQIAEDDAVIFTSSVLGGFRVSTPAMGDDAAAGSTATMSTGGGTYECTLDYPNVDEVDNNGACGGIYDRGDGPVFDLSESTQFQFVVQSIDGGMWLAVTLIDTNENVSLGQVQNVAPGQVSLPFSQLIPATGTHADLSSIDNIGFISANKPGKEGSITLSEFSTDGPITGGPVVPPDEEIVAEELSGSYFDPTRDGEGCQLTLERDGASFVLSCYFYDQGKQF